MGMDVLALERAIPARPAPQPREEVMDWETVDRLDWHLWILSILLIFVLGISLLSFMFPSVFWTAENNLLDSSQRAFFGFCTLMGLTLIYLLQRQATVRQLRRRLYSAQAALTETRRRADEEAFTNLPGTDQFRDALAMEYRRASKSQQPLGAAVISFPRNSLALAGRLAKHLGATLRTGESMYRISDCGLGVILPRMASNEVAALMAQMERASEMPSGLMDVQVVSYPNDAASLAEMEAKLRNARPVA